MVNYNQAYYGSQHIGYIYKNGKIVKKIYKGSTLVYQLGFDTVTYQAGTSLQTFTVPLGVSKIHVDCVASKGRDVTSGSYSASGGNGGRVQCDLAVSGGETLYITVGEIPTDENPSYNASDIRLGGTALTDRIIVAGGGGGGSVAVVSYGAYVYPQTGNGGAGGGTTGGGGAGGSVQSTGGTQSAGGTGAQANYGSVTEGGQGELGLGGTPNYYSMGGTNLPSAGGAGYYGGGGGATRTIFFGSSQIGSVAGGAGGGSSYTNANCSNVIHTQGYQDGAGYITISFVE